MDNLLSSLLLRNYFLSVIQPTKAVSCGFHLKYDLFCVVLGC